MQVIEVGGGNVGTRIYDDPTCGINMESLHLNQREEIENKFSFRRYIKFGGE